MKTPTAATSTADPFPKMIARSMGLHVFVVLLFTARAFWGPVERLEFEPSIRIDIVDLPDKLSPTDAVPAPTPATIPLPEKPQKQATEKKDINLNKTKEQSKAFERLKALETLEKISEEIKKKEKQRALAKGNQATSGSQLKGLTKAQFDDYVDSLNKHVKAQWNLPQWLADASLKARAVVFIDERGFVVKREIAVSSGNPTYDSLVLEAIDRSSPFPEPPPRFSEIVSAGGITLGFPE